MSQHGTDGWKSLRAVDRFRLQQGAGRVITFTILGCLAIPLVGILLLVTTNNVWLALPFLLIGALTGGVMPFVIAIVAVFFFGRRFMAKAVANPAAGAPAAASAMPAWAAAPAAPVDNDPDRDALLTTLDAHRVERLAGAKADIGKLVLYGIAAAAAGVLLNILVFDGEAALPLLIFGGMLALFGYFSVYDRHQKAYAAQFKDAVFDGLSSRYGRFERIVGTPPTVESETRFGIFPPHTRVVVGDRFQGHYRGAEVEIAEIKIEVEHKKDSTAARRSGGGGALLIRMAVPTPVPATTVALAANLSTLAVKSTGLAKVTLEDPEFEEIYEVFGADQIGSRAVLTPAVMQRLLDMANHTAMMPPSLLAIGTTMTVVLRNIDAHDWFEPEALANADMGAHLKRLETDLASVFLLVDTLIEMDTRLPSRASAPSTATAGVL